MPYSNTTTARAFTAADLAHLKTTARRMAWRIGRPVTVQTCADDGDEWAVFLAAPEIGEGHPDDLVPLRSVQTTAQPGRRLVILAADGRRVLAAGESFKDLVPTVEQDQH